MTLIIKHKKESLAQKVLKKHVAVIQSSNKLNLLQRKLGNALLFHASNLPIDQEMYELPITEVSRLIGYSGNDVSRIKKALKALNVTEIEWNVLKECDTEEWGACTLISGVTIRGGQVRWSYYHDFKQLLFEPEKYGKVNLAIQARFSSTYGLALYENCNRYRNLPSTRWFTMEAYRLLMGVDQGKYDKFRDFKRRVLEIAINEVNEVSDLNIEPELKMMGRKPSEIRFKIRKKAALKDKQDLFKGFEYEAYKNLGLTKKKFTDLLAEYGYSKVSDAHNQLVDSEKFKRGEIANPAGFLVASLEQKYITPKKAPDIISEKKRKEFAEITKKQEEEKIVAEQKRAELESSLNEINTMLNSCDPAHKKEIMQNFKSYLAEHHRFSLRWFDESRIPCQLLSVYRCFEEESVL